MTSQQHRKTGPAVPPNGPLPSSAHSAVGTHPRRSAVVDLALARVQSLRQDRPSGGAHVLRSCHLPPIGAADIVGGSRAAALAGLLRATLHCPAALHSGTLVLSGCGVDAADLHQIGDVLELCPHIHVLDMRDTPLSLHLVRALLQLLKKHSAVTDVLLDKPDSSIAEGEINGGTLVVSLLEDIHAQIARNSAIERSRTAAQESAMQSRAAVTLERTHAKRLQLLLEAEAVEREAVLAEESLEVKDVGKREQTAKVQLNSLLRRRVQAIQQKRLLDAVAEREAACRSALESASLLELLLLLEADCGMQRKLVRADVESATRALLKKEEVASWVLARRKEKARYQQERLAREELQHDEEVGRRKVHEAYWAACAAVEREMEQHATLAKSVEHARVEKARRDEAARKRLEDQARERAEKEEAQRQKALRDFYSKQQQAREKLEADVTTVRKGLRTIESALSGALFRIAASWFTVVLAREDLDRAANAYATLLQESPQASLTVHHWPPGSGTAAAAAGGSLSPSPLLSPKHTQSPAHGAAESPRRLVSESAAAVPHVFVMDDTAEMLEVMGPPNARSSYVPPWPSMARGDVSDAPAEPVIHVSLPTAGVQSSDEAAGGPPPTDPASPCVAQPTVSVGASAAAEAAKPNSAQRLVRFQCAMRDAWLSATKAAQQEFRQRCTKLEGARQAAKARCAEELKALRSAIAQHRLELARWKWPPQGILANATLLPNSVAGNGSSGSNSVSPVTSPKHNLNVSLGAGSAHSAQEAQLAAFVAPEPLADPLNLSLSGVSSSPAGLRTAAEGDSAAYDETQGPVVPKTLTSHSATPPTAASVAFHRWIDEAIFEFCSYGVHHRWLLQTIPSMLDDSNPFAVVGVGKELPVATLRSWKEAVSSCTVEVWLERCPPVELSSRWQEGEAAAVPNVGFELIRFDLPREGHEWAADVQVDDVRGAAAAGSFGNPFLFSSPATHRHGNAHSATLPISRYHHHHHAPEDFLAVLQASLRVRRAELEQAADAAREAGTAADIIDYSTIAAAKQCMEQWNVSPSVAQSLRQMLVCSEDADPAYRDAVALANHGRRLHFLARQFPSWAPVCRRVTLTYTASSTNTAPDATSEASLLPQGVDLTTYGDSALSHTLLTAAPSVAGFGSDLPPGGTQAVASGIPSASPRQLQSSVLCADVADFLASIDYYASSGCGEGFRAVQYRVEMSFELDLADVSHVFSVIRRLESSSGDPSAAEPPSSLSSRSVSRHIKQFAGSVPIVALRPRGAAAAGTVGSLSGAKASTWNSVVLSRVDVPTTAKPSSHASSGVGLPLPPAFPDQRSIAESLEACLPVALPSGSGSIAPAEAIRCKLASHFLGFELVLAYTPLFRPAQTGTTGQGVELQLCFTCDSRLWFSVPDASLRRDRSLLGTIYLSASGDGLHPVALLDVLHGGLVSTGTPPLSATSSSMASAKKAMSRKSLSGAVMAAAARKSNTSALSPLTSARSEQRVTCSMRVESTLVDPQLLAEVCARFAFATLPGCIPTLPPPLLPSSAAAAALRSSNPVTPRTDHLGYPGGASVSALFKADVSLRPPPAAVASYFGLSDPAAASVNCTPREEATAAATGLYFSPTPLALPKEWLIHPRLLRETPLAHCTVEVVPTWAPQSALLNAADAPAAALAATAAVAPSPPKPSGLAAAALPVGGYVVKPFAAMVVCSHRVPVLPAGADLAMWEGGYRVAPLKDCSTRIHFSDDLAVPEPAAVLWSFALTLSNASTIASDASPCTLTPLVTSRLSTPTDDRSPKHPLQPPPPPSVGAAAEVPQPGAGNAGPALTCDWSARFASTLRQTPLLRVSGSLTSEDRVVSVKLSVAALLTWLGSVTTRTSSGDAGGAGDEGTSADDPLATADAALISFATVRTDDITCGITVDVQLRSLDDFLNIRAPAVKLRHVAAVLLHALLPLVEISLCTVSSPTASPEALTAGQKTLLVEVEVKCKAEEPELKAGAKGSKKAAPKAHLPSAADAAAAWLTVVPKSIVGSVVVQPALAAQHIPEGSCILLQGEQSHAPAMFSSHVGSRCLPDDAPKDASALRGLYALIEHEKMQGIVEVGSECGSSSPPALAMLLKPSESCCLPALLGALRSIDGTLPSSSVTTIPCVHLAQEPSAAESRAHSWRLLPFTEWST